MLIGMQQPPMITNPVTEGGETKKEEEESKGDKEKRR